MIGSVATTDDRTAPRSKPRSHVLPGLARWASRSDVEQVRLYTVGSLQVIAWFLLAMGALAAGARLGETVPVLLVVVATVVLGVAVTQAMRTAVDGGRGLTLPRGAGALAVLLVTTAALAAWGTTVGTRPGLSLAILGGGAAGWLAGAYRDQRVLVGVGLAAGVATWVASGHAALFLYGAGIALFFGFTVASSLWLMRIVTELDRARGTQAALAVAEERLRFSRDVHDVLGRHLSTIAVQAELAATLVRRGDPRAEDKTLEVRASAHDALREARELARGYRPLDLATELDGAVSLLRSAGIEARADLDGLPEAWHEPVARVVREAVTNVLRHSDARAVEITRVGDVVSVVDDGDPRPASGDGSGLASLAEALAPLGARLQAGPTGSGFRVAVHLGEARPTRQEET